MYFVKLLLKLKGGTSTRRYTSVTSVGGIRSFVTTS